MQAVLHHHAETAFAEELGDMVVPRLGFDEEGLRTFSWDGAEIVAELGSDLKLAWSDSEGGKSWKTLPAFVPAAVKEDIKLLGKLLREAVKAQTARLEMALMLQRRWTIARWRELYEDHPLLRAFASGIVWGVHTDDGPPVRTFRRYHTGILADAGGREDELSENGAAIGMVHPLELDPDDIAAWQAHFDRLQLKPPFPQLQRPVERLDPLHANRRQISLPRDASVSAGTIRAAERIKASGVQLVTLLALSDDGKPHYDHRNAAALAALDIPVFACTPDRFPDLMAAALAKRDLQLWLQAGG